MTIHTPVGNAVQGLSTVVCLSAQHVVLHRKDYTALVNLIGEIRESFIEYLSYEVELDLSACREEFLSVSHPV